MVGHVFPARHTRDLRLAFKVPSTGWKWYVLQLLEMIEGVGGIDYGWRVAQVEEMSVFTACYPRQGKYTSSRELAIRDIVRKAPHCG